MQTTAQELQNVIVELSIENSRLRQGLEQVKVLLRPPVGAEQSVTEKPKELPADPEKEN